MGYRNASFASSSNQRTEREPAAAFVNIAIQRQKPDGTTGQMKLAGIPLRKGDADEKAILEWLKKPGNVEKFASKLVVTFNEVNPAGSGTLLLD
jgi:hypothetical protein